MHLFSETLGGRKGSPSTAVEHASVEVDAGVPRVEGVLPLLVDVGLVRLVVLPGHSLPVVAGEEGVLRLDEAPELIVGLPAEDHADLPPGRGLLHVLVAGTVVTRVVVVERLAELALDAGDLQGATDKVLPLVDSLAGPGVEEARAELCGSVRRQAVEEKLVVGRDTSRKASRLEMLTD